MHYSSSDDKKINFSWKKAKLHAINRNSKKTIESRIHAITEICEHLKLGRKFIYIDESGFGRKTIPLFGYAKLGKPYVIRGSVSSHNFSVIAAITSEKILGLQIYEKSVSAKDFGCFLVTLLNANPEIRNNLDNYVFFMDNARVHKAKVLKEFYENLHVCYNAPYSPFLNPIEEVFARWKFEFRKFNADTKETFYNNIIRSSLVLEEKHLCAYTKHAFKFFLLCLKGEEIE